MEFVHPKFVYPYLRPRGAGRAGELVVDEEYMQSLSEFKGKPTIVEQIDLWCKTAKVHGAEAGTLPKKAMLALTSRVAETFVLVISVPDAWLTKPGLPILGRKLNRWLGPDMEAKDVLLAMTTFQAVAAKVRREVKHHVLCCEALAEMVAAAKERKRVAAHAELMSGIAFPATVPQMTRDVVCLLMHLCKVDFPIHVLPPWKTEYIERMDVLALIDRMPETMGLPCEESFRREIPNATLHHLLVFCHENWAEEWQRRGWSTSTETRNGLKALHVSGWEFGEEDAKAMMFFSVYERKYES